MPLASQTSDALFWGRVERVLVGRRSGSPETCVPTPSDSRQPCSDGAARLVQSTDRRVEHCSAWGVREVQRDLVEDLQPPSPMDRVDHVLERVASVFQRGIRDQKGGDASPSVPLIIPGRSLLSFGTGHAFAEFLPLCFCFHLCAKMD